MKKFVLAAVAASLLSGCMSAPNWQYPAPASVNTAEYGVSVAVACHMELGIKTCTQYGMTVSNKTDQVMKIVWNDSAETFEGNSSTLLPDGAKYADATASKVDTVIPPHATITKSVAPSSNVYHDPQLGWMERLLMPGEHTIYLQLLVNDKTKGETFKLNIKDMGAR